MHRILTDTPLLELPNWYAGPVASREPCGTVSTASRRCLHQGLRHRGLRSGGHVTGGGERARIRAATALFSDLALPIEVRNQARVHLWYERRVGRRIQPYRSTEDAIRSWPTTATTVSVTARDGINSVFAPFGLDDLFDMAVKPNKRQAPRTVYEEKTSRWSACWPRLRIV
jgi:hypothetical protein